MHRQFEIAALPLAASVLAMAVLVWWLVGTSDGDLRLRLSDQDGRPPKAPAMSLEPVSARGAVPGEGSPADIRSTWSGFRGNQRTAVSDEELQLSRSWPEDGPAILWTVTLGEGYAAAALQRGCAYVLDYDEVAAADTIRCLSLDDGREVWQNSYPVQLTRNHGLSRTVPAISGDYVVTLGPRCHVACWDARTGDCYWLIDLVAEYGATVPRWYAGQCPLVDQDRVILASCGESLLIAIDLITGETVWESPNPRGWEMTHASIMPMQIGGQRILLYCGSGGIAGVAADDGRQLWDSTSWPTTFATCPSPLVLPDDRVFLCSGYGRNIGSLMLTVAEDGGQWTTESLFTLSPTQFNSEHHTPILYRDHIFGVRKRGGGQLVCLGAQGNEVWTSGEDRFGHGPYLIADGLIFVMDDHGWLTMAEATTDAYRRLGRCSVFPAGHDAWGPMALAGGRLIVRDMTRMACLDLLAR